MPVQELHDAPLAPLTTFRLGGPATRLVTATTDAEVIAAVREADDAGTPLLVIGGGSNLVIGDKGFDGTALRIATSGFELDGTTLELAAGEVWTDAVARTVEAGLAGHRVPGRHPRLRRARPRSRTSARTARRCPRTITEVVAYDRRTGETVTAPERRVRLLLPPQPLQGRPRALSSCCGSASRWRTRTGCPRPLQVRRDGPRPRRRSPATGCPLAAARETVLRLRAGKGMVLDPEDHDTWSAGSFFTNPILDDGGVRRVPRARRRTASARTSHRPPTRRARAAPRPPRPG